MKVGDLVRYKAAHRAPYGAMTDKAYIVRTVVPMAAGDPLLLLYGCSSWIFANLFDVISEC